MLCLVNPRHMRKGYGSQSVCVCVLSVTLLATTYLVFTSKVKVSYGSSWHFPDLQRVTFAENALFKVLASFADHRGLPCSLTSSRWTKEPTMASFQCEECIQLVIASTTRLTHH